MREILGRQRDRERVERLTCDAASCHRSQQQLRDSAAVEVKRAQAAEKEAIAKQEQLRREYAYCCATSATVLLLVYVTAATISCRLAQLRSVAESRSSELQAKCYESERNHAAADEARRKLRVSEVELERQRERELVLRQELAAAGQAQQCCVQAVEARLAEQRQQLESYKKLELELEDVTMQTTMQAAESRWGDWMHTPVLPVSLQ